MIHIIPIGDLKEHTEQSTCECMPSAEVVNGETIIIHYSYDGREYSESERVLNEKAKTNERHAK